MAKKWLRAVIMAIVVLMFSVSLVFAGCAPAENGWEDNGMDEQWEEDLDF